jgi:hypothetical protein
MLIIGFIVVSIYICFINYSKKKNKEKYMIIPINYNIYNNIEIKILDIVNNFNNNSIDEINEKINEIINLYIDDYFPHRNIKNINIFKDLKRKETIRIIKNKLYEKYESECLVSNNIELKRTIVLNKINESNRYFKIIEEMNDIDIIINSNY